MVVTVIFFESALELIPESLRTHSLIRKEWKTTTRKRNRGILLDTAIHGSFMTNLPEKEKRGRPDIVFYSLLNLLYSPLVVNHALKIIIHTYTEHCIYLPSHWRIPVNYNRFVGLFSQLLYRKRIPVEGEPILSVTRCTLGELLQEFSESKIYLLESPNENSEIITSLEYLLDDDVIFLIGGFQSGEASFLSNTNLTVNQHFQQISIYNETKPAWTIASRLLHMLEDQLLF
ncbi:MAG: hypothetical protein ACW97Z_03955 [Candidatus Hodarchaeales archaeon]|jgi:rRNA small subunit pseudouridine methyltransferase Nep1